MEEYICLKISKNLIFIKKVLKVIFLENAYTEETDRIGIPACWHLWPRKCGLQVPFCMHRKKKQLAGILTKTYNGIRKESWKKEEACRNLL